MVCCATSIVKILLGVFNFLFLLLGGGITYLAYELKNWGNKNGDVFDVANISIKSTAFIILGIGIVLILVSFFGFFGAFCENSFMLKTYAFLMVIMIAGQGYSLYYSISHKKDIKGQIQEGIKKAIAEIHNETKTEKLLNKFQCTLKCCGWNSKNDFDKDPLPNSCCDDCGDPDKKPECLKNNVSSKMLGCEKKMNFDDLNTLFGSSIGVSVAIILFELILVFAACCLAREYE